MRSLLFAVGFGLRFQLRQLVSQLIDGRFKRGNLGSRSGKITVGGGHLVLGLACKLDQRLLQKLDIGLQASGTALHLLFSGADLQTANVLCGHRRQQDDEEDSPNTQKLRP